MRREALHRCTGRRPDNLTLNFIATPFNTFANKEDSDSEVNHECHFIKILFINKVMEFIDLHCIFKEKSVISSVSNYFNNAETPIKPIRSTLFIF